MGAPVPFFPPRGKIEMGALTLVDTNPCCPEAAAALNSKARPGAE